MKFSWEWIKELSDTTLTPQVAADLFTAKSFEVKEVSDDILDIEGTAEIIGKTVGSDVDNHKSTYPSLLTLQGAKEKLADQIRLAHQELEKTGIHTQLLKEITDISDIAGR